VSILLKVTVMVRVREQHRQQEKDRDGNRLICNQPPPRSTKG